jgi:hypothetical protein
MHPKAFVQPFIGTEIKVTAVINLWVYFRTVCTVWHDFEGRTSRFSRSCSCWVFRTVLAKFWHEFRDSPYSINCWDSRTVVRIPGTKIEEHFPGLFRRIFFAKESPDKFV